MSLRFCVHYSVSDFKSEVPVLSFLISDSFEFSGQIYCFCKHGVHYNVFFNCILKLISYLDYKLLLLIGCYHRNEVNN